MTATEEVWVSMIGFEGLYEVSNAGRLRSINFHGRPRLKILARVLGTHGYYGVGLYKKGHRSTVIVHAAVARAFIGERPEGLVVNHIDGDKKNNHASNLEYSTYSENRKHAYRTGLDSIQGDHARNRKIDSAIALDIIKRDAAGERRKDIAASTGLSQSQISMIISGKRWNCLRPETSFYSRAS